jgi:hypothetical protein
MKKVFNCDDDADDAIRALDCAACGMLCGANRQQYSVPYSC